MTPAEITAGILALGSLLGSVWAIRKTNAEARRINADSGNVIVSSATTTVTLVTEQMQRLASDLERALERIDDLEADLAKAQGRIFKLETFIRLNHDIDPEHII